MLKSGMNNMRNFYFWTIIASFEKNNMIQFLQFSQKKLKLTLNRLLAITLFALELTFFNSMLVFLAN